MKFKISLCILLFITTTVGFTQVKHSICKRIENDKLLFQAINNKNSKTKTIDVSFYDLKLKVNPVNKFISGSVSCIFTPKTNKLNQIYLDLNSNLRVDSVLYKNNSINFNQSNNQLSIELNDTINNGQFASVQVFYKGAPQSGGLGTFVQNSYNGKDSIIWTLSQPYGASAWWPCKNTLTDKADSISISITTIKGNSVASIGTLQSIDTLANEVTFNWKSNYPIATYLVAFAITNYEIHELKQVLRNDTLLHQHFLYPDDSISVQQSLTVTPTFLHFFDSLFSPYPFIKEKYGHASITIGGGMEHQTMSFMGSYGGELIAHELAHQWFGNYITCASWQDLWLNEAFATYANLLTYEFNILHDSKYLPIGLQGLREISFLNPHKSVFVSDTSSADSIFTRVPYYKGASLLHMLRWKLGDNNFFNGIRTYLQDTTLAYSFAKTADLKRHLETSSGQNLTEFFNDWYYGKGYPTYTALWSQEEGELKITIQQTQSDPSVYFFNMPIPYQIIGPNIDSIIIIDPKFSGHNFAIPLTKQIDSIIFDPDKWIGAKSTIITSIESFKLKNNAVTIYPNPSNSIVYMKSDNNLTINKIEIYNIKGVLVKSIPFQNQLNLAHLPNGSYLLKLYSNQGVLNKQVKISH